ncbi:hypothetical protein Trydic_g3843, partial [Trypoxylus dichotomus]
SYEPTTDASKQNSKFSAFFERNLTVFCNNTDRQISHLYELKFRLNIQFYLRMNPAMRVCCWGNVVTVTSKLDSLIVVKRKMSQIQLLDIGKSSSLTPV